jgi:hypothetical protein
MRKNCGKASGITPSKSFGSGIDVTRLDGFYPSSERPFAVYSRYFQVCRPVVLVGARFPVSPFYRPALIDSVKQSQPGSDRTH